MSAAARHWQEGENDSDSTSGEATSVTPAPVLVLLHLSHFQHRLLQFVLHIVTTTPLKKNNNNNAAGELKHCDTEVQQLKVETGKPTRHLQQTA